MRAAVLGLAVMGVACATASAAPSPPSPPPLLRASPLRGRPSATGSALALADLAGARTALVADEDDRTLHVFDLGTAREVLTAKLGGRPSHVVVSRAGRVYVGLRDEGKVEVLEHDGRSLVRRGAIDVGGEPLALALTPDDATLLVASGFTHEVTTWSLANDTRTARIEVGREPRVLAVRDDGSRATVGHAYGGAFETLDLAKGAVHHSVKTKTEQSYALALRDDRVVAPSVVVDPSTFMRARQTYYGQTSAHFATFVLNAESGELTGALPSVGGAICALPRAVAASSDRVAFGCAGVSAIHLVHEDDPTGRTEAIPTDAPVSALAFDGATTVAWSQMGRSLTVLRPSKVPLVAHASGAGLPEVLARGRRIFHASDGRVARDNRTCATCHADGRDDGLVWSTPEGPRQTPMLAGRLVDTAPYGWTRNAPTLEDYVGRTIANLGGRGLDPTEMASLVAYVRSIVPPPRQAAEVKRGAELFASAELGCASCHAGSATTDGASHAVGGSTSTFATPSLRFVGGTPPYFHDGRFATLRDLLTSEDPDMGRARALTELDVRALEAYLRTL